MTEPTDPAFHWLLIRLNEDDEKAVYLELDDDQPFFDAENRQIRINLSGEQASEVKKWWVRQK